MLYSFENTDVYKVIISFGRFVLYQDLFMIIYYSVTTSNDNARRSNDVHALLTCNILEWINEKIKDIYRCFCHRVVFLSKLVAILEPVNSIQELNVYQARVVQVVNYCLQVIHVVHQEILAMYLKSAMERLLRYGNTQRTSAQHISLLLSSI